MLGDVMVAVETVTPAGAEGFSLALTEVLVFSLAPLLLALLEAVDAAALVTGDPSAFFFWLGELVTTATPEA
jgi:hypothetical protein